MTEIILLTKDECHFCEQAKEVLARIAIEQPLEIREVRLESDEGGRLAAEAGAPFPPVVFLDGAPFSYGRLSERRLRKALA
ncbi:MAG: glutaredoxin family protein [Gaiellaceae bacterium]